MLCSAAPKWRSAWDFKIEFSRPIRNAVADRSVRLKLVALSAISATIALEPSSLESQLSTRRRTFFVGAQKDQGLAAAEHAVRDSRREQRGRLACTPRPLSVRTGQRGELKRGREASWAAVVPGGNGTSRRIRAK